MAPRRKRIRSRIGTVLTALVCFVFGSVAALPGWAADPPANAPPPLTSAQVQQWTNQAKGDGQQLLNDEPDVQYQDGGERDRGQVTLAGRAIDVARLGPSKQNNSDLDAAKSRVNDTTLVPMKLQHDAEAPGIDADTGATGLAANTVHNSAAKGVPPQYSWENLQQDPALKNSVDILTNTTANGTVLGEVFADCRDVETTVPGTSTSYINESAMCTKFRPPAEDGVACTRERVGVATTPATAGEKYADLLVGAGANKDMCTRTETSITYRETLHQTRTAELDVNKDQGGLSCTRTIRADESTVTTHGSKEGDLPISTEVGGLSCTRKIKVSGGASTVSDERNISAPNSTPITVSIASQIPAGVTSIQNFMTHPGAHADHIDIITAPTLANGWTATLKFYRLDEVQQGPAPTMAGRLTWGYQIATQTASVVDTGDCGDPGSSQCPTNWSCAANAPTTVDGQTVTAALAQSVAPLYPGAPSTCAVAQLNRSCAGNATLGASISIASEIPPGAILGALGAPDWARTLADASTPADGTVGGLGRPAWLARAAAAASTYFEMALPIAEAADDTLIKNIQWVVTNPQAGVSVTMTQAPTPANGWVMGFSVTRTDFSYAPAKPHVRITWDIVAGTQDFGTVDAGNCNDPGSAACPTQWSCTGNAPLVVDGVTVTASIAASLAPLYPGAPNTCVRANLSRVCSNAPDVGTTVPIGDLLPPDVTEITNFAWTVNNPQAGITVTLVSAPNYDNGWTATFNVARGATAGVPQNPSVTLTWNVLGDEITEIGSEDEGNCSATPEGSSCHTEWQCVSTAPPGPPGSGGGVVTPPGGLYPPVKQMGAPIAGGPTVPFGSLAPMAQRTVGVTQIYPGADPSCTKAKLVQICEGTAPNTTTVSIAAEVGPDAVAIQDYQWTVTRPVAGVDVVQLQAPTKENGWIAIFQTTRTDWSTEPSSPQVHLTWTSLGETTYEFEFRETGDCTAKGDEFCHTEWTCDARAPIVDNLGHPIPPDLLAQQPPLFPGDDGTCTKATLAYTCKNVWSGTECWEDETGAEQCWTQPDTDDQPDDCGDLENRPECTLQRTECTDGGLGLNGHCYIEDRVYSCQRAVTVDNTTTTTQRICNNSTPCVDGSCSAPEETYTAKDRNDSIARQVLMQHVMTDWKFKQP